MKKWAFLLKVADPTAIAADIETKAKEVTARLRPSSPGLYRVTVTFYQKSKRWREPDSPREDQGFDLDNVLKRVFDGLGPIIGYRKDWTGKRQHAGVLDSSIVEVTAKKVNSGSDDEFLGVEVELI